MVITILGCSDDDHDKLPLTLENFSKTVKPNQDFKEITAVFGQPVKDIGSGIHIYVYKLNDGTEIWLGCTDKLLYANQMDRSHRLLMALI